MSNNLRNNFTRPDIWFRLLYMIVFLVLLMVARLVIWVVTALQFLLVLITGSDNLNLRQLGQGTAKWCLQAYLFLTFNTDEKPFPFSDWPELDAGVESEGDSDVETLEVTEEIVEAEFSEGSEKADDIPSFTEGSDEYDESDDLEGDKK